MTPLDLEVGAGDWIDALSASQARTIRQMQASGMNLHDISVQWLAAGKPPQTSPHGGDSTSKNYVERVEVELRKLICGDPAYEKLRKDISAFMKQNKVKAVGMIAAAVGAIVGLSAVVLVPVVGLVLQIACEVGTNAWCKTHTILSS
jgi:hypothetical protein